MALTDKALVTDCLPFSLFSPAFKTGSHALPEQEQNHTEEYQHNKITQDKRRNTNQKGADSQSSGNASVKHTCNTFKPVAVPQVKKNIVIRRELITHQKHPAYADNHQLPVDINSPHSNHTSTQHKNRLPALIVSGYISAASHKTDAGFRSLPTSKAHNRASGFFVRTVSPRLFRTRIMAGRTGPTSVGPGSLLAGTANPVRLATHSFAALDGEFSQLTSKEATPWQTASNSAPALSVFTSAAKSTADFSAQHASRKSCTSTCCMNARTRYQVVTARPSSAIWLKTWQNCKASSTSTDKPHPEVIPYLYAGGFRTSVTGGSHEER
ncbi:ash family protein [Escherichia coli]|nr:ash family protein [Escherichia coli]EFL9212118.1 ash family protein [Escherichia coli]EHO4878845.1 ash family protein [Escherichia coli]ELX0487230.1 ash family protein [Escherichia coli]